MFHVKHFFNPSKKPFKNKICKKKENPRPILSYAKKNFLFSSPISLWQNLNNGVMPKQMLCLGETRKEEYFACGKI